MIKIEHMNEDKIREEKIIKINAISGVFAIIFFIIIVRLGVVNIFPYLIYKELGLWNIINEAYFIIFFDIYFSIFCGMLLFRILKNKYAYDLYPKRHSFYFKLKRVVFFFLASIITVLLYFVLSNENWGICTINRLYFHSMFSNILFCLLNAAISAYIGYCIYWTMKKRFLHEE